METLDNKYKIDKLKEAAKNRDLPCALILACRDHQMLLDSTTSIYHEALDGLGVKNYNSYSDLYELGDFKTTIKKEEIIRTIRDLSLSPSNSNNIKILILSGFDLLTSGAANALLKFMEEHHKSTYLIFLTTNLNKVMPTLLSRSVVVRLTSNKSIINNSELLTKFIKLLKTHDQAVSFLYSDIVMLGQVGLIDFINGVLHSVKTINIDELPQKWKIIADTLHLQSQVEEKIANYKILINEWIGLIMANTKCSI